MADNYLEKKMEEFKAMPGKGVASRSFKGNATLSKLVEKNIQYKEFNNKIIVRESHLNELAAFAKNYENFECKICLEQGEIEKIVNSIKNFNPNLLNFNSEDTLPKAFIILGKIVNSGIINANSGIISEDFVNSGIILQTILLRATEMGLNGTYTVLENNAALAQEMSLDFYPIAVVAIGKGAKAI